MLYATIQNMNNSKKTMASPGGECCAKCYFLAYDGTTDIHLCMRFPPSKVERIDGRGSCWPRIDSEMLDLYWCGEFQPIANKVPLADIE